MGAVGTATLDFGAFPGSSHATVDVTGQTTIVAGNHTEAWIRAAASTDHTADEHAVEPIEIIATAPTAGTGFTIHGRNESGGDTLLYGQWNVDWVWN